MSNAKPLTISTRLDRGPFRTIGQRRAFRRAVSRHESFLTGELAPARGSGIPVRRPLAAARAVRSTIMLAKLAGSYFGQYVSIRCDPATCRDGHRRPRLHDVSRAELRRHINAVAAEAARQIGAGT